MALIMDYVNPEANQNFSDQYVRIENINIVNKNEMEYMLMFYASKDAASDYSASYASYFMRSITPNWSSSDDVIAQCYEAAKIAFPDAIDD